MSGSIAGPSSDRPVPLASRLGGLMERAEDEQTLPISHLLMLRMAEKIEGIERPALKSVTTGAFLTAIAANVLVHVRLEDTQNVIHIATEKYLNNVQG
jgi:hypothetical protein